MALHRFDNASVHPKRQRAGAVQNLAALRTVHVWRRVAARRVKGLWGSWNSPLRIELFHKYGENNRAAASRNFPGIVRASTSASVTSRAPWSFFLMTVVISCASSRP